MAEVPAPNPGETWQDYGKRVQEEALANANAGADEPISDPTFAGAIGGNVPKVDHAPTTREEAAELGRMFAEYRAEVQRLREELAAHRPRVIQVGAQQETPEQRREARLALIADHSHYCPACGKLGKYAQQCNGTPSGPHAPLEMVTTDELGGDPANHTKAPSTDPDQPDLVAA